MKSAAFGLAAVLAAGISGACWAQDLKATQKFSDTQLAFEASGAYANYTLTVTGPHGVHAIVSTRSGVPSFDLRQLGQLEDGAYNFHLSASTDEKVPLRSKLDDGRDGAADSMLRGVSMSGRFDVKGGAIVNTIRPQKKPQRQN